MCCSEGEAAAWASRQPGLSGLARNTTGQAIGHRLCGPGPLGSVGDRSPGIRILCSLPPSTPARLLSPSAHPGRAVPAGLRDRSENPLKSLMLSSSGLAPSPAISPEAEGLAAHCFLRGPWRMFWGCVGQALACRLIGGGGCSPHPGQAGRECAAFHCTPSWLASCLLPSLAFPRPEAGLASRHSFCLSWVWKGLVAAFSVGCSWLFLPTKCVHGRAGYTCVHCSM